MQDLKLRALVVSDCFNCVIQIFSLQYPISSSSTLLPRLITTTIYEINLKFELTVLM